MPFKVNLLGNGLPSFGIKTIITEKTLTRARWSENQDPHVDAIKPDSPARVLPFALNLIATSKLVQRWSIDPSVKGLVLLSGYEDTYVDGAATRRTLGLNAKHFEVFTYPGALHELDNELPDVRADVQSRTISFLNSIR